MRIQVIGAALACCLVGCIASARAQHAGLRVAPDRHATPVDYNKDSDQLFGQVKALYFAIGCKVVPSEASLTPYIHGLTQAFEARAHESGVQPNEAARMKQAASEGMAEARVAGTCAFWQQHPDIVQHLHRIVATGH